MTQPNLTKVKFFVDTLYLRRELSLGSHSTEARLAPHKPGERRRPGARPREPDTESTDSEAEEKTRSSHDKLSYAEYRRRRRQRDVNRNLFKLSH